MEKSDLFKEETNLEKISEEQRTVRKTFKKTPSHIARTVVIFSTIAEGKAQDLMMCQDKYN